MAKSVNPKLFLFGAFGHLLCWLGGDAIYPHQHAVAFRQGQCNGASVQHHAALLL